MAEGQLATRRLIALQYYARLPPRVARFQWPSLPSLLGIQDHLVEDLCLYQDRLDGIDYKLSFLKHLFTLLQTAVDQKGNGSEAEISGNLLEVYAELMSFPRSKIASTTQQVKYYYPASGHSLHLAVESGIFQGWHCITVEEEIYSISKGTTGLKTWEASLRLAAHLVAQPEILAQTGMVVLELGSGSGFLGALLSKQAEQAHIHLTDRDGIVLKYLERTVNRSEWGEYGGAV